MLLCYHNNRSRDRIAAYSIGSTSAERYGIFNAASVFAFVAHPFLEERMKAIPVVIAALLGYSAIEALAQRPPQPVSDSGFYLVGGVGRAWADIDNAGIDASVRAAGAATSSTTSDDEVSAWKLALGYQFNRHFALEVSYADFDNFKTNTVTTGPAGTIAGQIDGKSYGLDAVGILPITPAVDLFAKIGVHRWDVEARVAAVVGGTTVAASVSDDGTDVKFGVGARWNFNRYLGIQLEWERYKDVGDTNSIGKSDVDLVTVGLRWKF